MKSYLSFNQIFTLVSHTVSFCEKEYNIHLTTCCISIMKKTFMIMYYVFLPMYT